MSATDFTRLLNKLVPNEDGQDVLRLRTGTVTAVNSNGTADVTISGVPLAGLPVLGSNAGLVVGQSVQVLTYRGSLLVLGQVGGAAGAATTKPNAFALFGTPSIPNASITTLTPTSVPVNDGAMWTSGSNFTVPAGQGGLYEIGIFLRYASQSPADGTRQARINLNGADHALFNIPAVAGAVYFNGFNVTVGGVKRSILAAGDVVAFGAYQASGGALALATTGNSAWIERVR